MNHYLLTGEDAVAESVNSGRYATYALPHIIDLMERLGSTTATMKAQVFGGGAVVSGLTTIHGVGERNIEFSRKYLSKRGIRTIHSETGGTHGRKIWFETNTGNIKTRLIEKSEHAKNVEAKNLAFAKRKVRVLVVDDAALIQTLLSKVINSDSRFEVVGIASDAYEAREMLIELEPDVMTLDVIMPRMDGIKFLNKVMMHLPIPTVICSTMTTEGAKLSENAKKAGAIEVIDKGSLNIYKGLEEAGKVLLPAIDLASKTKVKKTI